MTHPTDDPLRAALERLQSSIQAALAAAPQPAPEDDYHNDPSADERWNAGCDYAMTALCKLLRINTDDVTWDAATEELEGDVLAVLGNILTVRFGDDWRKAAPQPAPEPGLTRAQVGQMLDAKRHDREALVEVIREARIAWANDGDGESCPDAAIADALLARGLRLPAPKMEPRRCAECDCEGGEYECTWIKPGPDRDNALQQLADLGQQADRASETMAWAVLGSDGRPMPDAIYSERKGAHRLKPHPQARIVRVAIRIVEDSDDAA